MKEKQNPKMHSVCQWYNQHREKRGQDLQVQIQLLLPTSITLVNKQDNGFQYAGVHFLFMDNTKPDTKDSMHICLRTIAIIQTILNGNSLSGSHKSCWDIQSYTG